MKQYKYENKEVTVPNYYSGRKSSVDWKPCKIRDLIFVYTAALPSMSQNVKP